MLFKVHEYTGIPGIFRSLHLCTGRKPYITICEAYNVMIYACCVFENLGCHI